MTLEFCKKLVHVLADCEERGVQMRPFCVIRTPIEQAKLWRQSRSEQRINLAVKMLRGKKAYFLADCLETAGPQEGPQVTCSLPGFSWHSWGQAADCARYIGGRISWEPADYKTYVRIAKENGLSPTGQITGAWPHIQLTSARSPAIAYSVDQINQIMRERYAEILY